LLPGRYDAQTRQSKVMKLIELLRWDFNSGDLLGRLEGFDGAWATYPDATNTFKADVMRIGIVIPNMETGALREHMLLHSEHCETYEEFRDEVDTIAKARSANMLTNTPMDIGAFKGKGEGKGFQGTCDNCGKKGRRKAECWNSGG
jgi:hypothetical protein